MKKIYLYILIFILTYFDLALLYSSQEQIVPSLKSLATRAVLDCKNDPLLKDSLQEALTDKEIDFIECLEFNGQVIQDIDLSGLYLANGNFSGCTFNKTNLSYANLRNVKLKGTVLNNVNLKGADLRGIFSHPENCEGCSFNNVNLQGALLYGDTDEESLYLAGKSQPSYKLIRQYSTLRRNIKLQKYCGLKRKTEILLKQVEAFKDFLRFISVDLEGEKLRNFYLEDLNLKSANLKGAKLLGVHLSKSVVLPKHESCTVLFNLWINGSKEEKSFMQVLLHCGVNLFKDVDNTQLQAISWGSKDLENADFSDTNLKNCNFIGVNLKKITLKGAYIGGVHLSESMILPNYPKEDCSLLFDLWIDGNEEQKRFMQLLLHCGVNLFKGVTNARLQAINWGSKDLENANFEEADLRKCNFTGVNLQKVKLKNAQLQGVCFSENVVVPYYYVALFDLWIDGDQEEQKFMQILLHGGVNLFKGVSNVRLRAVNWSSKKLENANFENIDLQGCNFTRVNLKSANLTGANLTGANLISANLNKANLTRANLTNTNLIRTKMKRIKLSYGVQFYKNDLIRDIKKVSNDFMISNFKYHHYRELAHSIEQIAIAKGFSLDDLDYRKGNIGCTIF